MKILIPVVVGLLSAAYAAEFRIYPTFSEVREQVQVVNSHYTFTIHQNDLCQVFPSSIGIKGTNVQSYQISTRQVPWVSQLLGKRVAVREGSGVNPATVVRVDGQVLLVQDEVTKRYYTTTVAALEYFDLPGTFQDHSEVAYQFRLEDVPTVQLHYLTRAVTWKPLYVLDAQNSSATLKAWAEIHNQTTETLKVDQADLYGGDVSRPAQLFAGCGGYNPQASYRLEEQAYAAYDKAPAPAPEPVIVAPEATSGGIYQYRVNVQFEVPARTTHALPLQESQVQEVRRVLSLIQNFSYNNQKGTLNREYRLTAPEFLLGGQFTIRDGDVFMGEAFIQSTPKGKELRVVVGRAPEATYERTVVLESQERVKVGNLERIREVYGVTLVLKNFKDTPVEVDYQESMNLQGRTWTVLEGTSLFGANVFQFTGILQPGEEKILRYRLQTERPY